MAKRVIGLELGTRAIRAVAMTGGRGGRAAVTRAETFRLPTDGDLITRLAAATGWLRQFLSAGGGGLVVAAVPPADGVTKILELPPASGSTLDELVRFEGEHSLPFAGDQALSDHAALRTTAETTTVLLTGARREVVLAVADWIKAAGGKARRVIVGAPARMELPLVQNSPATGKGEVTAVLDVDTDSAEILLAEKGGLRLSRSLSLSGSGDPVGQAAVEARRTVQAYRAAHRGASLSHVLLGGAAAQGERAIETAATELGVPVSRLDPWTGMLLSGSAAQLPPAERSAYTGATGLALQGLGRGLQLNLIPEADRSGLNPAARQSLLRIAGFLVASLSIMVWLATNPMSPLSSASIVQQQLATARDQVNADQKPGAGGSTVRAASLNALREEIRRDSVLWLEVLRQLSAQLPDGIVLTELAMEKGQQVVIRGSAKNNALVAEALSVVRTMPMFIDARIAYSNTTLVANEQLNDFELIAVLEPLAVAKGGRRR